MMSSGRRQKEQNAIWMNNLINTEIQINDMKVDGVKLKSAFRKAKQMLRSGTLKNRKAIVQQYVKQVTIYNARIEIEYKISDTYCFREEVSRGN